MQLRILQTLLLLATALCSFAYTHGDGAGGRMARRDAPAPGLGAAYPSPAASSASASIMTAKPNKTISEPMDYPTLPPMDDDFLSSMSAVDQSHNAEISLVMSEASASLPCLTVTDVEGTPVKMCGPTQASAPPGQNNDAAAGMGGQKVLGMALMAAAVGVLWLQW